MTLSLHAQELWKTFEAMDITAAERIALVRTLLREVPDSVLFSHISFGVRNLSRSIAFYDAALEPLGHVRVWTEDKAAGYGPQGPQGESDCLALFERTDTTPPGSGFHLALTAGSRDVVDRFHAACMAAGAADHGGPGLRPHYGPLYYACFVADPDGYKLEAVYQGGST
jgi:catechol 2,3-dioxygenase-like lactoylglutathione lyase family enzyme